VYLVRKKGAGTGAVFALKLLKDKHLGDENKVRQFQRECAITCNLEHGNVIKGIEHLKVNGVPGLLMEYFEADHLDYSTFCSEPGNPYKVLYIVGQILDAVAYLHSTGSALGMADPLVHRDLGLHNVLVDDQLDVKVVDFQKVQAGRWTSSTGSGRATTSFSPPELSKRNDPLIDIYSVGAIMFTLVTGHLLLREGQTSPAAIRIVPPPDVGRLGEEDKARLDTLSIAAKAAALDPMDRFQTVKAFREAVRDAACKYKSQMDDVLTEARSQAK